jgi:hypothetical protein
MKRLAAISLVFLASMACSRTASNNSAPANRATGTSTSNSTSGTESNGAATDPKAIIDLTGTWIATEGPRTWELVINRTDANTWTTTPTLLTNTEKNGLVDYGPPGSKGDTLIIVSNEHGKFRVRYAEKKNFHDDKFWPTTGTYDANSFNIGDYYLGKRKK